MERIEQEQGAWTMGIETQDQSETYGQVEVGIVDDEARDTLVFGSASKVSVSAHIWPPKDHPEVTVSIGGIAAHSPEHAARRAACYAAAARIAAGIEQRLAIAAIPQAIAWTIMAVVSDEVAS